MFFGRSFLVLLLAASFLVMPEQKAEAGPIFRGAVRAVGAVVGAAAGAVVLAGRAVARVGIAAFNVGRFLLFGRPLFAGRYWNRYCSNGCSQSNVSYSNSHGEANYAS